MARKRAELDYWKCIEKANNCEIGLGPAKIILSRNLEYPAKMMASQRNVWGFISVMSFIFQGMGGEMIASFWGMLSLLLC